MIDQVVSLLETIFIFLNVQSKAMQIFG